MVSTLISRNNITSLSSANDNGVRTTFVFHYTQPVNLARGGLGGGGFLNVLDAALPCFVHFD